MNHKTDMREALQLCIDAMLHDGGCRCARDHMKMQHAMYAANELRNALAEIERLDRAKGE